MKKKNANKKKLLRLFSFVLVCALLITLAQTSVLATTDGFAQKANAEIGEGAPPTTVEQPPTGEAQPPTAEQETTVIAKPIDEQVVIGIPSEGQSDSIGNKEDVLSTPNQTPATKEQPTGEIKEVSSFSAQYKEQIAKGEKGALEPGVQSLQGGNDRYSITVNVYYGNYGSVDDNSPDVVGYINNISEDTMDDYYEELRGANLANALFEKITNNQNELRTDYRSNDFYKVGSIDFDDDEHYNNNYTVKIYLKGNNPAKQNVVADGSFYLTMIARDGTPLQSGTYVQVSSDNVKVTVPNNLVESAKNSMLLPNNNITISDYPSNSALEAAVAELSKKIGVVFNGNYKDVTWDCLILSENEKDARINGFVVCEATYKATYEIEPITDMDASKVVGMPNPNPQLLAYDTIVPTPSLTIPGYKFLGWKSSLDNYKKFVANTIKITENINLKGYFEKDLSQWATVTFVAGTGGTIVGGQSPVIMQKGSLLDSAVIPTPEANLRHEFIGWSTTGSPNNAVINIASTEIKADTEFTAMFSEKDVVTVRFVIPSENGFADATPTVFDKFPKGLALSEENLNELRYTIPAPTPKNDYKFLGWSKTASKDDIVTDFSKEVITADTTYTAMGERTNPEMVTVNFFATDGGTIDGKTTITIKNGERLQDTPMTKEDDTHVFVGWSTTKSFDDAVKDIGVNPITENTDFYAMFAPSVKLGFDLSAEGIDGSLSIPNSFHKITPGLTIEEAEALRMAAIPNVSLLPDYEFTGWTVEGEGTLRQNDEIRKDAITKDTTYVANVRSTKVKVEFVALNGSTLVGESTKMVSKGTMLNDITPPMAEDTETHYFIGWSDNDKFFNQINMSTIINEDTTIYGWYQEKAVVTVTGKSDFATYNGVLHEIQGYEFTISTPDIEVSTVSTLSATGNNPENYTLKGITATATGLNKGNYYTDFNVQEPMVMYDNEYLESNQFRFVFNKGTLRIDPAPLTIRTVDTEKFYGDADPAYKTEITKGSLMLRDKNLEIKSTFRRQAGEDVRNGVKYEVTPQVVDEDYPNYNIEEEPGMLEILQAEAFITVFNSSKEEEETDPTFTAKVEGNKNNEQLRYTYERDLGEAPGNYQVRPVLSEDYPNYKIDLIPGNMEITAKGAVAPEEPEPENTEIPQNPTPEEPQPEDDFTFTPGVLVETPEDTPPTAPAPVTPPAEEEPATVAAAPAPAPVAVAAPAAAAAAPTVPEVPTATVADGQVPLAEGTPAEQPVENIEENKIPLVATVPSWALLNLLLAIVTVVIAIALISTYVVGKKKNQKTNIREFEDRSTLKRKGIARIAGIALAICATIIFLLTQDMRLPMVLTDNFTILMAILAIGEVIVAFLAKKSSKADKDEFMPIEKSKTRQSVN